MANRGEHLDRDMRKVMQEHAGNTSIGNVWGKVGMWPVQMMDHLLSFPLWLSVYRDALTGTSHLSDAEAKYQAMHKADGAVRMGLGASAPKDLAPMFRNNDLTKALTTLGGFHNLKYNQIADVVQEFRGDRGSAAQLSTGLLLAAVIPPSLAPGSLAVVQIRTRTRVHGRPSARFYSLPKPMLGGTSSWKAWRGMVICESLRFSIGSSALPKTHFMRPTRLHTLTEWTWE